MIPVRWVLPALAAVLFAAVTGVSCSPAPGGDEAESGFPPQDGAEGGDEAESGFPSQDGAEGGDEAESGFPSQDWAEGRDEAEFSFTFEDGAEGWTVGFADLPVDYDQSIFELDHGHRPLPDGLEGNGIYVKGHNRSDDLFMFLKRQVGGLREDAIYTVEASVDLATNVPANSFGIGGSPGTSVYVKAGVSAVEPETAPDGNRHLRMNIDTGSQSKGGDAMVVLGNVAHPGVADREYRLKTLDNADRPLERSNGQRGPSVADSGDRFRVRGPDRPLL